MEEENQEPTSTTANNDDHYATDMLNDLYNT